MATFLARTAVSGDVDHLVNSLLENLEYFIQFLVDALLAVSSDNNDTVDGSLLELGYPLGVEWLAIASCAGITEGFRVRQHPRCEAIILGLGCIDPELMTDMICQLAAVPRLKGKRPHGLEGSWGRLERHLLETFRGEGDVCESKRQKTRLFLPVGCDLLSPGGNGFVRRDQGDNFVKTGTKCGNILVNLEEKECLSFLGESRPLRTKISLLPTK